MAKDTRNSANKAWANLVNAIGDGLHFAKDMAQEGIKGSAKWIVSAASMVGDWVAYLADGVSGGVAEIGNSGSEMMFWERGGLQGTNFSSSDGFLDVAERGADKELDKAMPRTSKWGKTKVGGAALDLVEWAAEIFTPGTGVFKGIKVGSKAIGALRNTPKAIEELKGLAKLWKKVEQAQVDEIVKKYSSNPAVLEKAIGEVKVPKVLEKMLKTKTPEEITKILANFPKLNSILEKVKASWKFVGKAGTAGAIGVGITHDYDDGISLPEEDVSEEELKKEEAAVASDSGAEKPRMKDVPRVNSDGTPATKPKEDAPRAKNDAAENEEKEAIASFEELKKANPKLNVVQSITDYMKARKLDNSFENRMKLADKMGIKEYRGSASQNLEMFKKIQEMTNDEIITM